MSCPTCGNQTEYCLDPRHNEPDTIEVLQAARTKNKLIDSLLDAYEAAGRVWHR